MKSSELGKDVIRKELPLIPKSPGVYRMLNHKDDILYVGKAKNLPNRLKSYVSEKNHIIRTERMLSQTFKLEITTTANESEIDRNQQGVEYLTALYRPDRYRIEIDLSRAGDEDSRYWQTVDGESD